MLCVVMNRIGITVSRDAGRSYLSFSPFPIVLFYFRAFVDEGGQYVFGIVRPIPWSIRATFVVSVFELYPSVPCLLVSTE